MNINISFIQLDPSEALKKHIEAKFSFLTRLISHLNSDGSAVLFVEIQRITRHHQKGEIYKVTVVLKLSKKVFRVSESHANIRSAIDIIKATLRQEVGEYKERLVSNVKKTGSTRLS